jgi:hypothetical protein
MVGEVDVRELSSLHPATAKATPAAAAAMTFLSAVVEMNMVELLTNS